jgi:Flp pilus assembly protein TadD
MRQYLRDIRRLAKKGYSETPKWPFALLFLIAVILWRVPMIDVYEDSALYLWPSAQRAAAYGEQHLDSRDHPDYYDIDRAEALYLKAAALDDTYPYVNHQLARINFLKGNLGTALLYIDKEIELHGEQEANTYYVRGLIEGYMQNYDAAVKDYAYFVTKQPNDWAAINDYAWVLLKDKKFKEAEEASAGGLVRHPDNPWLLNSHSIALYELHRYSESLKDAEAAQAAVAKLSLARWSGAYPGNDPSSASQGLGSFKAAVQKNINMLRAVIASSTVQ